MTRRDLVAAAGATLAGLAAPAVRATGGGDVDVVVVGAGAAGIAAAHVVRDAGLTVAVVEARERIGGRAFTADVAGRTFDAGAAYVHYRDRNPWVEIAASLGIPLEEHRGWGRGMGYDGAEPLTEHQRDALADGRRTLWRKLDRYDPAMPDAPMSSLADGETEAVRWSAARYGQQAIGEDPEAISLADLHALWSGDDFTVPGGYGRLVQASGKGLPVTLGAVVREIRWDGPGVTIVTSRGSVTGRTAVVTLPLGVLAAETVRFTPGLPDSIERAVDGLGTGALTKVALALDGQRFGLASPTDLYEIRSGLVIEMFPFDRDLALATIGGTPARDLIRLGEAGAVAATVDVLAGILGNDVRKHVVAGRLADWWTDPFALGSYSVVRPGRLAARAELMQPVAERLWIAGEATAGGGAMTVGGATLAGREAARAAVAAVRGTTSVP
ncbi:flavin monoamine oxidase family protein [Alsobacter sp. R-9]